VASVAYRRAALGPRLAWGTPGGGAGGGGGGGCSTCAPHGQQGLLLADLGWKVKAYAAQRSGSARLGEHHERGYDNGGLHPTA